MPGFKSSKEVNHAPVTPGTQPRVTPASKSLKVGSVPVRENDGPECPKCKGPMRLRENKQDGTSFWGCRMYPSCRGTLRGPDQEDSPTPVFTNNPPIAQQAAEAAERISGRPDPGPTEDHITGVEQPDAAALREGMQNVEALIVEMTAEVKADVDNTRPDDALILLGLTMARDVMRGGL